MLRTLKVGLGVLATSGLLLLGPNPAPIAATPLDCWNGCTESTEKYECMAHSKCGAIDCNAVTENITCACV